MAGFSNPIPRSLQPKRHEGSAMRSGRDADNTSKNWLRDKTQQQQNNSDGNALSKIQRQVDKMRRKVNGGFIPSIPSTVSNFKFRGNYYADGLNASPNNSFKIGDCIYMDDSPDEITIPPWGSNAIGCRITATTDGDHQDVRFKMTPYPGVQSEAEHLVLNFGWRYFILCIEDIDYGINVENNFLQLFCTSYGGPDPGLLDRATVNYGPNGGPSPIDDHWIAFSVAEIFLKIETP